MSAEVMYDGVGSAHSNRRDAALLDGDGNPDTPMVPGRSLSPIEPSNPTEYPGLTGIPIRKTDPRLPISKPHTLSAHVVSASYPSSSLSSSTPLALPPDQQALGSPNSSSALAPSSVSHSLPDSAMQTGSARVVAGKPPAQTITIPGVDRPTLRRAAKDHASGLSAYLVANAAGVLCNVTVSLKRGERLVGAILKGHNAPIVDMEFLSDTQPTNSANLSSNFTSQHDLPPAQIYILGTCDADGVVFLWFLEVVKNSLDIETSLRVRRKFSFYSLRKSKDAHYSRIRLSGSAKHGNMVLVPNDGSNVRVIRFHCDARSPDSIPVIEPPRNRGTAAAIMPPPVASIHPSTTVDNQSFPLPSSSSPSMAYRSLRSHDLSPASNVAAPAMAEPTRPASVGVLEPSTSHKFDRASSGLDMGAGEEVYDGGEASTPADSASSNDSHRSPSFQNPHLDSEHLDYLDRHQRYSDMHDHHTDPIDENADSYEHPLAPGEYRGYGDLRQSESTIHDSVDDGIHVVHVPPNPRDSDASYGESTLEPPMSGEYVPVGHHEPGVDMHQQYRTLPPAELLPHNPTDLSSPSPVEHRQHSAAVTSSTLHDSHGTDEYGADERVEDEVYDDDDDESLDYKDAIGQNQAHMAT